MKKFFLSFALILAFVGQVTYERVFGQGTEVTQDAPFNPEVVVQPQPIPDYSLVIKKPRPNSDEDGDGSEESDDEGFNIPRSPVSQLTPVAPAPVVAIPPPVPVSSNSGQYRDGSFTGNVADAYFGNVQIKAVVSGGKISDVQFLDYPQDRQNSVRINTYAMPILKSEAIQAQSANVDGVSGATATSGAFRQSFASALTQAKN